MKEEFRKLINAYKRGDKEDVVGLYEIISHVKRDFGAKGKQEIEKLTLSFVSAMLEEGFQAGESVYLRGGYRLWEDQKSSYIISRIKREWQALGREPNIGDIVYFGLPGFTYQ
jgi:hypothetical protein